MGVSFSCKQPLFLCAQGVGTTQHDNHILGKGVFREIRRTYEDANLVAMDCDAGASEVNQLNRLKLMLSVAKEKCPEGMQLAAPAESTENVLA